LGVPNGWEALKKKTYLSESENRIKKSFIVQKVQLRKVITCQFLYLLFFIWWWRFMVTIATIGYSEWFSCFVIWGSVHTKFEVYDMWLGGIIPYHTIFTHIKLIDGITCSSPLECESLDIRPHFKKEIQAILFRKTFFIYTRQDVQKHQTWKRTCIVWLQICRHPCAFSCRNIKKNYKIINTSWILLGYVRIKNNRLFSCIPPKDSFRQAVLIHIYTKKYDDIIELVV